jgi:hypothetical protein
MAHAHNPEDDPGWARGMSALVFLVPGVLQSRARRAPDGLLLLRQVIVAFSVALVLLGVVLASLNPDSSATQPLLMILVVMALGSVLAASRVGRLTLDCGSPERLASSYRTRFFLRVACAEAVAMAGFVFAVIGGGEWLYVAGAAFALYRFWSGIAPTRSVLAEDQRQLFARGCTLNLVAALRTTPPTSK